MVLDKNTLEKLETFELVQLYYENFGFKPNKTMRRRDIITRLSDIRVVSKPKATHK